MHFSLMNTSAKYIGYYNGSIVYFDCYQTDDKTTELMSIAIIKKMGAEANPETSCILTTEAHCEETLTIMERIGELERR
jgi:hypothetical protein